MVYHVWRKGLHHTDMLDRVDYVKNGAKTTPVLSGFTNVTRDVARVPSEIVVFRTAVTDAAGRHIPGQIERKSTERLAGIIEKFTMQDDLVINLCAGTLPVGRASLFLPKHRQCILEEKVVHSLATACRRFYVCMQRKCSKHSQTCTLLR